MTDAVVHAFSQIPFLPKLSITFNVMGLTLCGVSEVYKWRLPPPSANSPLVRNTFWVGFAIMCVSLVIDYTWVP